MLTWIGLLPLLSRTTPCMDDHSELQKTRFFDFNIRNKKQ